MKNILAVLFALAGVLATTHAFGTTCTLGTATDVKGINATTNPNPLAGLVKTSTTSSTSTPSGT